MNSNNDMDINNNMNVKPDDYDTGIWIKVVNKKKVKREEKLARLKLDDKEEYIKKLKEKKLEERKNAECWYDTNSWQHKILSEQLSFKDGDSISDKYNLSELIESYKNAKNNYRRNGIFSKLMRIITKEELEEIANQIEEI